MVLDMSKGNKKSWEWIERQSMPHPKASFCTFQTNEKVFFLGGYAIKDSQTIAEREVFSYNINEDTWEKVKKSNVGKIKDCRKAVKVIHG